jgi:hypothetical protein
MAEAGEGGFAQALMESLPVETCVLDRHCNITMVNGAWRRFGLSNPPVPPSCFVGDSYLQVCDRAQGPDAAEAALFAHQL